ncbi:Zn finger protein [Cystobasidiomycetes sp. EMM_F5]
MPQLSPSNSTQNSHSATSSPAATPGSPSMGSIAGKPHLLPANSEYYNHSISLGQPGSANYTRRPTGEQGNAQIPKGYALPKSDWRPDAAVTTCEADDCSVAFGPAKSEAASLFGGFTAIISQPLAARRHHCRACGKIFCSSHSAQSMPLLALDRDTFLAAIGSATGAQTPFISTSTSRSSAAHRSRSMADVNRVSSSTRRSGSSTPMSTSQEMGTGGYFDGFSSPAASPPSAPTRKQSQNGQVVVARVCDLCALSLALGANLSNPLESFQQAMQAEAQRSGRASSLPRNADSSRAQSVRLANRGSVSLQTSPETSQHLSQPRRLSPVVASRSSSTHRSTPSTSAPSDSTDTSPSTGSSGRFRQISGESSASDSQATLASIETQLTSPPASAHVSPKQTIGDANDTNHPEHHIDRAQDAGQPDIQDTSSAGMTRIASNTSVSTVGPDNNASNITTTPAPYKSVGKDYAHKDRVSTLSRALARTQVSHPLDPRHSRVSAKKEEAGGSNPDSSLEAVLPGTSYTWST